MLRKILKNKKAQNTAEYAILIALVVAAIVAMQTYAQRALQARVRDASKFMADTTNGIGTSTQYEPYYLQSNYVVDRDETEFERLDNAQSVRGENSTRTRRSGGSQVSTYDASLGLSNGL